MKSVIREYGLIAVVIVSAMVGYLFYSYNKEAVIDYALDNIGERLVQLLDNESSQSAIRQRFAALKSRILDEEVESAAVEQMAANVLNLSAAGQRISEDEANMLLNDVANFEMQALASADSGAEETPETALAPAEKAISDAEAKAAARARKEKKVQIELEKLGEQLASAIRAEEQLRQMAELSDAAGTLPPFVVVTTKSGLRFQIDSMMVDVFAKAEGHQDLKDLEKQKIIVWKKHLAEMRKMSQEQAMVDLAHVRKHLEKAMEIRSMAIGQAGENLHISVALEPDVIDKVRILKELEAKGVWIPAVPDSIQKIVISTSVAGAPVVVPGRDG